MRLLLGHFVFTVRRDRTTAGPCEACHWFRMSVDTPSGQLGHCHRMAQISGPHGQTFFPKMRGNQSCGQWSPRRGEGVQ